MTWTLHSKAWGDLWKRYAAVLRHAWRHRQELDSPARLPHEAQFLPAALALQETPPSPAPRMAMWLIMSFALLAVLWATFGQIDMVATAQGRIVPGDRTKTIQPIETATVKAIHVHDGQSVKAGDVLIELDATNAQADRDRLTGDLGFSQLQAARSKAMLAALDSGKLELPQRPAHLDESRWQEALSWLSGQHGEYLAKLERMDASIAQRQAELESTRELVHKLEQTAPLARQRAQDFKELLERSAVSKHAYLEKQQAHIEQESDLAAQRSRLNEIEAALREAEGQKSQLTAETRRTHLDSLNDGMQKAAATEQELLKADTRGKLMTLTAPVEGTVQQLAVHTVGGVVTPAQALMVVVPRDDALEIEAFVENKDIGFVRANQNAEIKIETFPYTKYGTLHAKVLSVSHDAINDEKRGLIYTARVRMERSTILVDGTQVHLGPGMAVTVEIKTGKRRVIEYFLSPLLQYGHESLRER
ncbi:MAG: HlyD family type I secretion periplasmic adaptor subunit [Alphaproteobacteria bacterium]|nr:MAG: HlyD family type I secretion periplasmic adaptor subunit [Alphaproteobacteria bacterium]